MSEIYPLTLRESCVNKLNYCPTLTNQVFQLSFIVISLLEVYGHNIKINSNSKKIIVLFPRFDQRSTDCFKLGDGAITRQ